VSMSSTPHPETLGKYRILEVIGAGAMGIVFKAHDPGIDRIVAVKTIRKELLATQVAAEMVARFRQEAVAAGRLSHPGIVAVYDYGEAGDTAYIVMEYAPGTSLSEFVRSRGLLNLPEVGAVMYQLLDALAYAHSLGIIHRDLKPDNLLVIPQGRIKISDFGVARIPTSRVTQAGTPVGTPSYMAPEFYLGAAYDHRADLFSAGVVVYELLTGALPFEAETLAALGYQICHTPHVAPSRRRPELPPILDDVVARALAKNPAQRYEDAYAFLRDLAGTGVLGEPPSPGSVAASAQARLVSSSDAFARTVAASPASVPGRIAESDIEDATRALAVHVGPIARVLVKRALVSSSSRADLYARLAEHIGDPELRRRWLQQFGVG
jgi:eukaryotic-like serine/threonine-protein kinase